MELREERKQEQNEIKKVKKPVRSISGVTPLTVVLKPRKCDHGTCIYCTGGDHVPQSYTDKSPAIMRALSLQFDPYEQVQNRLKVLKIMGHPTDKIEIIVLGGTFLQYDLDYQYNFIKRCFDSLNGQDSKSLDPEGKASSIAELKEALGKAKKINESKSEIFIRPSIGELKKQLREAQLKNETAEHRCVALCIENRPDNCNPEEIERMLEFGCTRVEIGVQMPDDELYRLTNRGHLVEDVVTATRNLKNAGFKLGYHVMPGLPYSNPEKDMKMFKQLFDEERFRPDQLKIYPCQVVDDSPLGRTHELIGFKPYDEEQTKDILRKMMEVIPEYCRVMRIMREFPKDKLIKGLVRLDLRKDVEEKLRESGIKIREIRMREVGFNRENLNTNLKLRIIEYDSSGGKEFFLQIVNDDNILFGLLRLRLVKSLDLAMVRELHVYGKALEIGEMKERETQHKGLGKMLMERAEEISLKNGFKKVSVICGVGVREYYEKLGYNLEGPYMVKTF